MTATDQPSKFGTPPDGVVSAFLQTAEYLYASEDLDETLHRLTVAMTQTVPGCEFASVTLAEDGRYVTRGETRELPRQIDEIQYQTGQGPCLDAAETASLVYTPNMANDTRWPAFSARVAEEAGVGSLLSCRLCLAASPQQTLGAINLYGMQPDNFTEQDRDLALLFAAMTAVILDSAKRQGQLREAMKSREVIGQAMGVLMAQSNLTPEDAFDHLRRASQRMNVKLRDVAARIAASQAGPRELPEK
jgi:GAF domain-containing protein